MKSATLANEVNLVGRGLFSGKMCTAMLRPRSEVGIVFQVGGEEVPAVSSAFVEFPSCSVITNGSASVRVVEHLMAALWAAGIDSAEIEVTGPELPNKDGSALWQYDEIVRGGRVDLADRRAITHTESIVVGDKDKFIIWTPGASLEVTYMFEHPELGASEFAGEIDREYAAESIIPARSFITENEAKQAMAQGHLRNTHEEDALLIRAGRPVTDLRFADEYVRHKVLDLLGDLYVIPYELTGRIACYRSGHALNRELARKLSA